ncbi:DUF6714 family protein [Marinibactrum halimedae]|uniref:Uncharacterized protein n=1 Tax=Marinibactrum halimedae TaxID=1444977 RepID=A0AA37WMH4_9GAMM|nr:DUF6714 family protein [Marinibactrum halimedae]MCD9461243.1 hypothetical protein [Marinibactrum halimedae]GLS27229.1 hypothetical protein GCM10007877_29480 [Marinibactrum halimedae]
MCDRESLILDIEKAFKNVCLGEGIGVFEANAIDDFSSEEIKGSQREKDVRDNWKLIPDDVIDEHYHSLSFMDDDGFRFAIPSFMIFSLKYFDSSASAAIDATIFTLAKTRDWGFLSAEQKRVIASFLKYIVIEAENHVDTFQASLAYENIWAEYDE